MVTENKLIIEGEYKIENNIPLPIKGVKGLTMYPFIKMKVGDSIFIADKKLQL